MALVTLLLGGWLAAGSVAAAAAPAFPADCEAVFVDTARVLSDAQAGAVSERASQFRTDTGYEIRIRLMNQDQAPFMEQWVDEEQARCASWRTPTGGFRTNLILLALTTDTPEQTGETGLYVGDDVPGLDEARLAEIRADVINPDVANGDLDDGILAGIAAVQNAVDPKPSKAPYIFGGIVVVAALAITTVVLVRRAGARRHRRDSLTTRFGAATNASDALVLQLDQVAETLGGDVQLAPSILEAGEAAALIAPTTKLTDAYGALTNRRSELMIGRDLLHRETDLDAIERVVRDWEDLQKDSESLLPLLSAEESRLAAALTAAQAVPDRVAALDDRVAAVERLADDGRAAGYAVDEDAAVLATVPEVSRQVRDLAAQRKLMAASARLDAMDAQLAAAHEALGTLEQRANAVRAHLDEFDGHRREAAAAADRARTASQSLQQGYPGVWAAQPDDVPAAEALLADADSKRQAAQEALDRKDIGTAEDALAAAAEALVDATARLTAVPARLDAAARAKETLPARVQTALEQVRTLATDAASTPSTTKQQQAEIAELAAALAGVSLGPQTDWVAADAVVANAEKRLAVVRAAVQEAVARHKAQLAARRRATRRAAAGTAGASWWSRSTGGGFRSSGSSSRRSWSSSSSSRSSSHSSSHSSSRSGGSSSRSSGGRTGGSSRR